MLNKALKLIFFAMFAVVITHETSVCRPVDTSVCFLNSPISFRVANDWCRIVGERDVDTDPEWQV